MSNSIRNSFSNQFTFFQYFIFILFCVSALFTDLNAQNSELQKSSLPLGRSYTIKDIVVTGDHNYNENNIIGFSGIAIGDKIKYNGDKVATIIRKLWDLELFSDVSIFVRDIQDDDLVLEINVTQIPEIAQISIEGVSRTKSEELLTSTQFTKGKRLSENLLTTTKNYIQNEYKSQGYLKAKVRHITRASTDTLNGKDARVDVKLIVDKGTRFKVKTISFSGNHTVSDKSLRRAMKNTKEKRFFRLKRSKYSKTDFKEDKQAIVNKLKEKGFRDAQIISDSLYIIDDKHLGLNINVNEGTKYYIGDIKFVGNTVYTDKELAQKLVLKKGDIYNGTLLEQRVADNSRPDGDDLTNLYQNNGYLFSKVNLLETAVRKDTIDFDIRIQEGKLVYFNKITATGNDRTNDHVIYRSLRTLPGQQYSKDAVVRTIRELGQLGFFDAESLQPEFKNANPQEGTIDINYNVTEKGSSQIELQGGFGGGGFVGTLGLSFNNFSLRNIFNKDAYKPLPMGDGQSLSIRAQASQLFQTYSLSFSEPWLGGRRPFRLSASLSHTIQYYFDTNGSTFQNSVDRDRRFLITGGSLGIARRLDWPDNYFTLSQTLSMKHYNLQNYTTQLFTFGDGHSNNLAYEVALNRNNTSVNPIFPTSGSQFNVSAKFSLPYSLFKDKVSYQGDELTYQELSQLRDDSSTTDEQIAQIDQLRFKWLEYYKLKFNGTWYTTLSKLADKPLVLRSKAEYGLLGAYNKYRGNIPFERFFLGGDGLGGFALDGRENIALRGYINQSVIPASRQDNSDASQDGAVMYNKYLLELRYPITLKPQASVYMLSFLEGGASYDSFKEFNPFKLYKSAGFGLRVFMPAFGLLGIDFGYGLDPTPGTGSTTPSGWQTHFIIGQSF